MPRRIIDRIRRLKTVQLEPAKPPQKTAQTSGESLALDKAHINSEGRVVLPGSRVDSHDYPPFDVDLTPDQKKRFKELKKRARGAGAEFTYNIYEHDSKTKVIDVTLKAKKDKNSTWHQISLRPDKAVYAVDGEVIRSHDVDPSQRRDTIDFFLGAVNRALSHANTAIPITIKKKPKEIKQMTPKGPKQIREALAKMKHMRAK
jgi:hypothetical protein